MRRTAVALTVIAVAVIGLPLARADTAGAAACNPSDQEAFLITGRIHPCGTALVDAAGHRVRLQSFELLNMYGGQGDVAPKCGHWSPIPIGLGWKVPSWGMNSVQILISWANLEPTPPTRWPGGAIHHHWNTDYLAALDRAIDMFRRHGVAVVLSLGQSRWSQAFRNIERGDGTVQPCGLGMPSWLYPRGGSTSAMVQAELRFFQGTDGVQRKFRYVWQMLARRYRNNPAVVAANMLFEAPDVIAHPYLGQRVSPQALDLARFYELTGRAIHAVNPYLLVLYADWQSLDASPYFAISRKPLIWNAAYAYEFYAFGWSSGSQARLERYHLRAEAWGVPGYIDEFDAFNYGRRSNPTLPDDPNWQRDTLALLAQTRSDRTGWSFNGLMDSALVRILRRGH